MSNSPELWSIVLAGGDGRRILPFIQSWLGSHTPKQYCTFIGSRSLLQHTISRACRLSAKGQVVTIIDRTHREYAAPQLGDALSRVIVQPLNRETAPGIYLPLTYIRSWSKQAIVVIYPSDHFVYPEDQFLTAVRQAIEAVGRRPDKIVVLGIKPDDIDIEYGFVCPGPCLDANDPGLREVSSFVEKPDYEAVKSAESAGALWNTFVMAATVEQLWNLGWNFLPEIMVLFESLQGMVGTAKEQETLDLIYASMPTWNFSSDLLQRAPEYIAVMELEGVLWSDWGQPERIISSLRKINKEPAFSPELLLAGGRRVQKAARSVSA